MVFVRHQVGELFLTRAAVVRARLVAVFVVEQRASVAVPAPALIANVRLTARIIAAALWRVLVAGLHQGQVEPGTPSELGSAARGGGTFRNLLVGVV